MAASLPHTINEYVTGLDPQRGHVFHELSRAVDEAVGNLTTATASFVFAAEGRKHPVYRDDRELLWLAATSLALGDAAVIDELPLLFVGYHGKVRLTRRRYAQGFLLTDARIVAQDDFEPFGEQPVPRSFWLGGAGEQLREPITAASLVGHAWGSFDNSGFKQLGTTTTPADLQGLLTRAVEAVIVRNRELGHVPTRTHRGTSVAEPAAAQQVAGDASPGATSGTRPAIPAGAPDLGDRVRELGLTDVVKLPGSPRAAKHLVKLGRALGVEPDEHVLLAVSDSTLAGVYGLAITDRHVRSKDLLEPALATPRAEVVSSDISPDGETLIVGAARHTLPSSVPDRKREALALLLKEQLMT